MATGPKELDPSATQRRARGLSRPDSGWKGDRDDTIRRTNSTVRAPTMYCGEGARMDTVQLPGIKNLKCHRTISLWWYGLEGTVAIKVSDPWELYKGRGSPPIWQGSCRTLHSVPGPGLRLRPPCRGPATNQASACQPCRRAAWLGSLPRAGALSKY